MKLPDPLVRQRLEKCPSCACEVDKSEACAQCPKKNWGPILCNFAAAVVPENAPPLDQPTPPTIPQLVKTALQSAANWVKNGFQHTDEETLTLRIECCRSCEFWNPQGFKGTGRCMKCGCSTWAKLRMATEQCPIGKWGPVLSDKSGVSHTTNNT